MRIKPLNKLCYAQEILMDTEEIVMVTLHNIFCKFDFTP